MSRWITTQDLTKDIKNKRTYVRNLCKMDGEKIVDIWHNEDKDMYFAYVVTKFHSMWRYSISFMHETVDYHIELFK